MPNSTIFSGIVANYSREPLRRIDIHVSIDRFNDIAKAEQIIVDALKSPTRVARQPEPVSGVQSVEEYSVVMLGRFWVSNEDQFRAPYDLRRIVQDALQANGISIPVTRQAVATREGPGEPDVKEEVTPTPSDSRPTEAA